MTPTRPEVAGDLDISDSEDGLVVYQASNDRVHYLNHTAGTVLALCDGTRTAADIASFLADGFSLGEPPMDETMECVAELIDQGLVR